MIFDSSDYKAFLKEIIQQNQQVRGFQSKLAEAAGCQRAYLSQVLNGAVHLTPDHALGIGTFLGFSEDEQNHFQDLLAHSRAGREELRGLLARRLKSRKTKAKKLATRIGAEEVADAKNLSAAQLEYYSHWLYPAIHVFLTIPDYEHPEALAKRLGLESGTLRSYLNRLEKMGLAVQEGGKWKATKTDIHLPKDSAIAYGYNSIWRQMATVRSDSHSPKNLPFSGIYSIAKKDIPKLHELGIRFIQDARKLILKSPAEDVVVLNLDVFGM